MLAEGSITNKFSGWGSFASKVNKTREQRRVWVLEQLVCACDTVGETSTEARSKLGVEHGGSKA